MPQTITALKIQKRDKTRVNVYLDGEYAFAVSLNVALGLKKGQSLTPAEIADLKEAYDAQKAYDKALHFLGFRARSEQEVQAYLHGKGYTAQVIETTLSRLQGEGYLDDAEFARVWLSDRERLRPRGARALRYELRQKGVADSVIEETLADLDEQESAWAAIAPKLRQWRGLDWATFHKKATGFLSRRGFAYQTCQTTLEQAWERLQSDDL